MTKTRTKHVREPLVHLTRRLNVSKPYAWGIRIGAFVLSILACAIVSMILSKNVTFGMFFKYLFKGAFGTTKMTEALIREVAILLLLALAVTPCFKMRYWNIGGEGQAMMGAFGCALIISYCAGKMSVGGVIVLSFLTAIAFAMAWALIPALFKAKWNTNETLFTLMMNYIIIGVVAWLQSGPWEARQGRIAQFPQVAWLPKVEGVHCGWIIVLVLVLLVHIYMRHTKQGYEIAVIGDSLRTAQYAGMNVGRIMMRTMFLSGAISGLVGFILCSGATNTLSKDIAGGVGFTSITVAWLSQLNAFAMVAISLLLGILTKGADTLQTVMNVPAAISDIIIGLLLFCMLGCEFFINYRLILRKKAGKGGAAA